MGDYKDEDGMEFAIVPKEFVIEDTSITTILRNVHRKLDLQMFPKALYHRNQGLRGGELQVTHSKCYGAGDKTRNGQPKEGWRLLFLKGCPTFMSKLENYPESHRFVLGTSGIQIWGGNRKKESGGSGSGRGGNGNGNGNNNGNNNRNWGSGQSGA